MEKILLDTNFILSCIRKKIDFFEELIGYEILVPIQVINEIKRITESNKKLKFKDEAKVALKLLEKSNYKKINLEFNYVDRGIKKFVSKDKKIIVATLDDELKKILERKLVIRGKKLEIM
jgi:rRNA-processing protein FCF1